MKNKKPKKRNIVFVNMITRRQKAGSHGDKKKKNNRNACRGPKRQLQSE